MYLKRLIELYMNLRHFIGNVEIYATQVYLLLFNSTMVIFVGNGLGY